MGSKKRLTDASIRALRPKQARYEVWDTEPGFGLRVAPSGRKSFIYLYRFEGRPRRMTLGVYPRFSLADAREAVGTAIKKLDKGIDPGAEKIAERKQARDAETFRQLANEWVDRWAKPNRKTWREAKRQLEADAIPAWGSRKAKDIKRRDVIQLVESIVDRGSPIMANRTLQLLKQVFKFGVQRDILDASPAVAIDRPAKERRRDRVLSDEEIRIFWSGLDKAKMSNDVRIALKLCLITAQRRAEITGLSHSEIDGDWWTLPKERSKNGKAHRVYLTPLAKDLIAQASGDNCLFPSPRQPIPDETRPIDADALTKAVATARNQKIKGTPLLPMPRFTTHDLRRTAATKMAETGISRFDIAKVLNHADVDVTAVYDHYAYDAEKKKALLAWSRRLNRILEGKAKNNVVNIK